MEVQNLLLLQALAKKEKKLDAIEKRQASVLSLLKREYETLKVLTKQPRETKQDKLMKFKSLRNQYTFKREHQGDINEHTKNESSKASIYKTIHHVHELSERRSKMILAGNSFSQNNRKSIQESSIRKVSSTMGQLQIKREMLARRNEFGNSCTASFINRKASRPSTANPLVNNDYGNPSGGQQQQAMFNKKKYQKVVDELKLSFKETKNDGEIYHDIRSKASGDEMINEIRKPSIFQTEIVDSNKELYHRASEVVDIGKILKAYEEVSEKVSEVIREEMIDYDTIDDAIMREVKKASIECSQSEIDDESNIGLNVAVIDDSVSESNDLNDSMRCVNSSMSIVGELREESVDRRADNIENTLNIDQIRKISSKTFTKNLQSLKAPESSKNLSISNQSPKVFESSEKLIASNFYCTASFDSDDSEATPTKVDPGHEITSKKSFSPLTSTSNAIIMKLKTAFGGMFPQLIDDVTQPVMTKLCAHKNSSNTAVSNKNADTCNKTFSSSSSQKICKLSSQSDTSTKLIDTTSTFTSKKEIFNKTMEIRKRKIEGENEDVNESMSNISNKSFSDSSSIEIVKRVVNFDE